MTLPYSPATGTNLPRPYEVALRLAQHRTSTALHTAKNTLSQRLTDIGLAKEDLVTAADIRRARNIANTIQRAAWRDTARIVGQSQFDAASAAVDMHLLPHAARQAAIEGIQSAIPSASQALKTTRNSQKVTTGWLNTLTDNLLSRQSLTGQELVDALHDWFDPNQPGGLSYAAERLTENELATSFHEAQVNTAEIQNIQTVFWRLDPGHEGQDECDDYADQEFDINDVPDLPHIGCLCYLEPGETATAEEVA